MDRKTRVIESVRDKKGELFLGAMALGGVGIAAASLRGDDEEAEADDDATDADDAATDEF